MVINHRAFPWHEAWINLKWKRQTVDIIRRVENIYFTFKHFKNLTEKKKTPECTTNASQSMIYDVSTEIGRSAKSVSTFKLYSWRASDKWFIANDEWKWGITLKYFKWMQSLWMAQFAVDEFVTTMQHFKMFFHYLIYRRCVSTPFCWCWIKKSIFMCFKRNWCVPTE